MVAMEYLVHFVAYYLIMMLVLSPFTGALALLPERFAGTPVALLLLIPLGLYLLGATWVAHRAAYRRAIEGEAFFGALGDAIRELRVYLTFVPIIGPIVGVKTKRSQFEEPTRTDDQSDGQ